jgi:purine-binding chemotaxis protein CheW
MSRASTRTEAQAHVENGSTRAGKYLTFRLAAEEFGLKILKVREIIGLMPITKVPQTPDCVRGMINLRDKVIPVLELRKKFGMEGAADTEETCIIVVDMPSNGGSTLMGILVDAVSEVLDIKAEEIQDSPSFGGNVALDFILGIGKVKGGIKILLDIDRVLADTQVPTMTEGTETEKTEQEIAIV